MLRLKKTYETNKTPEEIQSVFSQIVEPYFTGKSKYKFEGKYSDKAFELYSMNNYPYNSSQPLRPLIKGLIKIDKDGQTEVEITTTLKRAVRNFLVISYVVCLLLIVLMLIKPDLINHDMWNWKLISVLTIFSLSISVISYTMIKQKDISLLTRKLKLKEKTANKK